MVRIYGDALQAITGGDGIDVPLVPRRLSDQQNQLREQQRVAAIEAAETTAAAARTPLPRRRGDDLRMSDALSLPASARRSAPAHKPSAPQKESSAKRKAAEEKPFQPEFLGESEVIETQECQPKVMPGFDVDVPTQVRQLKTELGMAGQRITALLTQVEEQGACIASALVDLENAASITTQLSELATEQQDLLRARAETAERDLQVAHRHIEALIAELSTPAAPAGHASQGEPVMCLGTGCGLPVAPEYVARTGFLWHGPCKDLIPAAARFSGRRVA